MTIEELKAALETAAQTFGTNSAEYDALDSELEMALANQKSGRKPEVIVNVLTAIERTVTDKWTTQDGSAEGYGSAPNIVNEVVYELLLNAGYKETDAEIIADRAQQFVEYFVISKDGELTYD